MFHGWRIVGISASAQAMAVGTTFYTYGVFVKPLATEFDAPRLVVVLGLTLFILVQAVVSPMLGRALDVRSARTVMTCGVLLCASGFLGLSIATSLWQVGVLFGLVIAIGSHMFGPLATSTLIANWFVRQRGRALGVTAVGASVGGFLFPMVATRLMESFGWRGAALTFGVVLFLFSIPFWLLVVNRPEELGARPDGDLVEESGGGEAWVAPTGEGIDLVRSTNFWVITAAVGLAFCSTSVLIAHLVPYVTDLGFEPGQAAIVMSTYAASGAIGRLAVGFLADRIDKQIAAWIVFATLAAAWIGLVVARSYVGLLAAGMGMGLGVGGLMPLWGSLTGACFGRAVFGRAMGLMNPLMLPFNLAGAPLAAYVFDRTGSYGDALSAFVGTFVLGGAVLLLLRVPKVEPGVEG